MIIFPRIVLLTEIGRHFFIEMQIFVLSYHTLINAWIQITSEVDEES